MARLLFTASSGGVSRDEFTSFNLALHVGDQPESVEANRYFLQSLVSTDSLVFMDQIHGNDCLVVDQVSNQTSKVDALITQQMNVGLVVQVADCLPILIEGSDVVAALHVGRRGMANGLIQNTVAQIRKLSSSKLVAMIGPGICGKCYEVDELTYEEIVKIHPQADAGSRHLDVRRASSAQLIAENIEVKSVDICTKENMNFYSYRRDGKTGRQVGVIAL